MRGHKFPGWRDTSGMVFNIIGRVNLPSLVGWFLPPVIFLEYIGRQWETARIFFLENVILYVYIFGDVAHIFPGHRIPSEWRLYLPADFFMKSR